MSKSWGEIREEALRRCGQLPPKTNADRIRSMTDEELADELLEWFACFFAVDFFAVEWSREKIIEYLKQEVDE